MDAWQRWPLLNYLRQTLAEVLGKVAIPSVVLASYQICHFLQSWRRISNNG